MEDNLALIPDVCLKNKDLYKKNFTHPDIFEEANKTKYSGKYTIERKKIMELVFIQFDGLTFIV